MLKYTNDTVSECPLYRVELHFHECRSEGPTHTQGTLEKFSEQSPAVVLQLLIQMQLDTVRHWLSTDPRESLVHKPTLEGLSEQGTACHEVLVLKGLLAVHNGLLHLLRHACQGMQLLCCQAHRQVICHAHVGWGLPVLAHGLRPAVQC